MLLSLSWLREFVPYSGSATELGDRLTMLGLELDGIVRPYDQLAPIVVGHVVSCEQHPDSDHLSVCRVDVGDEVLDIVCGAPNIAFDQKVPVIKVGSTLPSGLLIKKTKLRGQPSHGMVCSERELGLSEEHDGILVLDPSCKPGTSILDILPLDKELLDISITPNRGDCLSVLGIAREVALTYRLPLHLPSVNLLESDVVSSDEIQVTLENSELSPLYLGRLLKNANINKSPAWLRYRLQAVGLRPISNIVDSTNYVLFEQGQPFHAFDFDAITDGKIIVTSAKNEEKIVTLDGQERLLLSGDITIRDTSKVLCLGGIMGGQNSEITDQTKNIFLESAVFAPWQIRRTARRLGLQSDSSYRFERGVDQTGTRRALDRVTSLIVEVSGASLCKGIVGAEPKAFTPVSISFSPQRAENLIGVPLSEDFCEGTFQFLGCTVDKGSEWSVTVPGWRNDLLLEADLFEELARIYGIDSIPEEIPAIVRTFECAGKTLTQFTFINKLKKWAAGIGLNETINYSFVSSKLLDTIGTGEKDRIFLQNPLSEEQNILRTELVPSLLTALRTSVSQEALSVRIFEVGHVFCADSSSETTANEPVRLGILLHGTRTDRQWPNDKGDLNYTDIKGIVEHLFKQLNLPEAEYTMAPDGPSWLLPAVSLNIGGKHVGFIGKVIENLADQFNARKEVWVVELDVDVLYNMYISSSLVFTPLTQFPLIRRDITFVAKREITGESIRKAILGMNIAILEDVSLIDCFEPENSESRNLTYRLTFRHPSKTLKENEVNKQRDILASKIAAQLGVTVQGLS